jgi:hypothetical protein
MTPSTTGPACVIDVRTEGPFPATAEAYARDKVGAVLRLAHEPVLSARVRLTRHADPAVPRPVIVKANLDVNGRPVRACVAAATEREGVDLLEARLRSKLERSARHWEAKRGRMSYGAPHEWRHDSPPTARPDHFPRPFEEREVISQTSFGPAAMNVDDAAEELDQLDYDFYLFTEAGTRQDTVIYHAGPTGYRLAQVEPVPIRHLAAFSVPLTVSGKRPPLLTTVEAIGRLELTGQPFLFFLDADRGRGAVVYHRYDGHYGVLHAP